LIESKSLPSLYGMLALALHDVSIVEDSSPSTMSEESTTSDNIATTCYGSSHLSITLPCKTFRNSSTRYYVTVSFARYLICILY